MSTIAYDGITQCMLYEEPMKPTIHLGNIGLKNILLIGMTKNKSDFFYNLMETSAIEAWGNDDADNYSNVHMDSNGYWYYDTNNKTFGIFSIPEIELS